MVLGLGTISFFRGVNGNVGCVEGGAKLRKTQEIILCNYYCSLVLKPRNFTILPGKKFSPPKNYYATEYYIQTALYSKLSYLDYLNDSCTITQDNDMIIITKYRIVSKKRKHSY